MLNNDTGVGGSGGGGLIYESCFSESICVCVRLIQFTANDNT